MIKFLVAFLIFGSLTLAPSAPFAIQPADGRPYFNYQVAVGEIIIDEAILINRSAEPIFLKVWSASAKTNASMTYTLMGQDWEVIGAADWVRFPSGVYAVPADSSIVLPFQIEVPGDAQDGEYLTGLLSQIDVPEGAEGLSLINQNGAMISLKVGAPDTCKIEFLDIQADLKGVKVQLTNPGNLHFSGAGILTIEREDLRIERLLGATMFLAFDEAELKFKFADELQPGRYQLNASLASDEFENCRAIYASDFVVLPDTLPAMGIEHPPQGEPPETDILGESVSVSPGEAKVLDTPLVQSLICGLLGAAAGLGVVVLYAWRTLRKSKTRRVYSSDLYTSRRDEK